jgi:hypothetical protein
LIGGKWKNSNSLLKPWEGILIKKDIQKHLEKMGKIKVYKKPNFNHKNTQEEYNSALEQVAGNIESIKDILSKKMNIVKLRILDICINNLEDAFKHYYNTFTYSRDPSTEKKFSRAINELKGFMRAVRLEENNKEETETKINWLSSQFSRQAKYIMEIEKEIRDNNIEPFSEIVENLT